MAGEIPWPRARLIPVSGIGSQREAETRATSAVLAVLGAVRDLSNALFGPLGAPRATRATVETFTEPLLKYDGKKVRPDGAIRITYGKKTWTALVEVKTGDGRLDADQINLYWVLARSAGYDAVVTISNEIAAVPGWHPTEGLKVRANSRTAVHHISWTRLLTTAVTCKVHHGVSDPEQAWILGELIRYLEHPASGAMAFDDMGPSWTTVRDGARDGMLRRSDAALQDIAVRWDQLMRFASLHLGARTGEDVQHLLPRAHRDQKVRVAYLVESLCTNRPLDATIWVPNTACDIEISADLKARRLSAAATIDAPTDRGGRARCSWLLGQLGSAPADLIIEAYPRNARTPVVVPIAAALESRDLLLGETKREPTRFRLAVTREMGVNRKTTSRSPGFIDSTTGLIDSFYGDVVQHLSSWRPRAPRITSPAATPAGDDGGTIAEDSMRQQSPFRFPQGSPSVVAPESPSD